eukprot:352664-Chlamydomonas_euryale.AAC.5
MESTTRTCACMPRAAVGGQSAGARTWVCMTVDDRASAWRAPLRGMRNAAASPVSHLQKWTINGATAGRNLTAVSRRRRAPEGLPGIRPSVRTQWGAKGPCWVLCAVAAHQQPSSSLPARQHLMKREEREIQHRS